MGSAVRCGHVSGLLVRRELRVHAKDQLARLPEPLARLDPYHYPVEIGLPLRELAAQLDRRSA
jgi:hypothetical protein